MKIAFVLDDSLDKSDGVQQYILSLGNWYKLQGHDVHYIVGQTERTDIPNVHSLSRNVQTKFNQNRMSTPLPASRTKIKRLLSEHAFDVLHVQMPYSPFLAGRVIKLAPDSAAVVGTFHIIPFSRLEALATTTLGLVLRRSKRRFDAIYSVSRPAQRFAKQAFKISTSVMPNVVNLHQYQSSKPFSKYADNTITIVFLGRLVERKGCLYLLQALNILHSQHNMERVRVIICGKGPLQEELETFVKKNHLGNIVHFVGFVDESDKARYLASADIAVFPSTGGESFGIVLIEAMAAGAQVVLAGDNAGYASVIGDRKDQMVNPKNAKSFAKTLHHFISNEKARKSAATWQREHVKNYDVKLVGNQLLSSYESIVAKRSKTNHNNQ